MLKPNTFIKATATTLAACMLMACGGASSNNDNETLYTLSLESEQTGVVGKSTYTINVTDKDGLAVYGETPIMKPMMAMAADMGGHHHSSPHVGCTETDNEGNSACTVYFSMGSSMGTWSVDIELENAETLTFNPNVTMPMDETVKVNLKGVDDKIGDISRTYTIFNNSMMASNGNRNIELFISSKENMMSFPALVTNTTLSEGTDDVLSVDSIEVQISTDIDAAIWTPASTTGKGVWTANIENYTKTFYVKLSVNSEVKVSSGKDYATFSKQKDMADK